VENSLWKRLWTHRKTRLHHDDDDDDDDDDDEGGGENEASFSVKIHPFSLLQCRPTLFDLGCKHFTKFRSNVKISGAKRVP
jgi:hypothetical protein